MNWLHKKWVKSVAYWAGVFALMVADGSVGWDDLVIGILAIPVYFGLIWKGEI